MTAFNLYMFRVFIVYVICLNFEARVFRRCNHSERQGMACPYMKVQRRKYRFRIVNSSNAHFYRFALSNGLNMTQVGSDSAYLPVPVRVKEFLLAPSEIADIVVDFYDSATEEAALTQRTEGATCRDLCGSVPVKYPFGTGPGYGDPRF